MTARTHLIRLTCGPAAALLLALACDVHIDVEDPDDDTGEDEGGEDEGGEEEGGEDEGGEDEGGEDEGGEDEGGEDEGGEEDGGEESSGGEGGEDSGGSDSTTTGDDGGGAFECDLFEQDCPAGEKCAGWANDGGNVFNATRCSPIDDMPMQPGDICEAEGSGVSGIDNCDIGAQCLFVDPETNDGICVALCSGSAKAPVCDDPETTCQYYEGSTLTACLAE